MNTSKTQEKAFTDAEIVKECAIALISTLKGEKSKSLSHIQAAPLSNNSLTRCVKDCVENVNKQLGVSLKSSKFHTDVAIDESTDIQDIANAQSLSGVLTHSLW